MLTKKIKRDLAIMISVTFGLFLGVSNISADTTPYTDNDGSVTGQVNATYYKVTSWEDMFDAYKSATKDQKVYLSVQNDIAGSSAFSGYNGQIVAGRSVDIIGNNHKIYADNDTNYSTATSRRPGFGFYSDSASVTGATKLSVEDATIINNHADGIFVITGSCEATTVYKNVHTTNGNTTWGAGPIRNDKGTIQFLGNNVFNMLQGQSMVDLGSGSKVDMSQTKANMSGADNNGEWIQGGQNVEVVNGETTVNQSWGYDQPFYTYATKHGSNFSVDDNAKLNWNLNETYTMWYDDGPYEGPLNWNIGKSAAFVVNGTKNTAIHNSNWFMTMNTLNALNINMAHDSLLDITTGGGSINLDGFQGGKSIINMASGARLNVFNLNSNTSLFSGTPAKGSEINLNDPNSVTLKTMGGSVFQTGCNIPININGNGLRLHASTSVDANLDSDLYKRATTGVIDGNFSSANMTPTQYTQDDLNFLRQAKYIRWSQPEGAHFVTGDLNRTFEFNLKDCPKEGLGGLTNDGAVSKDGYITGKDDMNLTFCADEGTEPNVKVQVAVSKNNLPNQTAYYWRKSGQNNIDELSNEPYTILSVTDDEKLPQGVSMKHAGEEYDVTLQKNDGLLLKAGNGIPAQNDNTPQASFIYSIVDAQ